MEEWTPSGFIGGDFLEAETRSRGSDGGSLPGLIMPPPINIFLVVALSSLVHTFSGRC